MKKYRVAVTETLRRVVLVEAVDEDEAHSRVSDAWSNGEVILTAEDFHGAEFYVLGESTDEEQDKYLDLIDGKLSEEEDEDGTA